MAFATLVNITFAQHADWIVKFDKKPDISQIMTRSSLFSSIKVLSKTLNVYNLKTSKEVLSDDIYKLLPQLQNVSYNAPIERRSVIPNDVLFDSQWSLKLIGADRVWEETTGGKDFEGKDVVVAILDDGFDVNHQDLVENYWTNDGEIPNDNIDNDNNGFTDDFMGVNIQNNTGIHPGVLHGTQVAGIIGARGNNARGIAGINWNTKILLVSGVSNIGQIIEGLEYLYDLKKKYLDTNGTEGANIVVNNFSGGISYRFPNEFMDWCDQYDLLGTVGILSVGSVANADFDVEVEGDLPTLCDSDHLIMVTNSDISDTKVLASAYGLTSVDLAAPGEEIISTGIGNDYKAISGTSASAPHVAGAVSLLYTVSCDGIADAVKANPSSFALTVKNAILNSVDVLPTLDNTFSKGRLNIFKAVFELNEICGESDLEELQIKSIRPNFITSQNYNNVLTIDYGTDVFKEHQIFIHNTLGQLIHNSVFTPNIFGLRSHQVNTTQIFAPGTYVLSIVESGRVASSKFVVVK
jgi:subtilisin family serine protease